MREFIKKILPKRRLRWLQSLRSSRALSALLKQRGANQDVIIMLCGDRWYSPLFQRYQHFARSWAEQGNLVIYSSANQGSDVSSLREVEHNLFISRALGDWKNSPNVIFYTHAPHLWYLLERLPADRRLIYDHLDDLALHDRIPGFKMAHDQLVRRATLVVYSSDSLRAQVQETRFPPLYVPNGVDFNHFHSIPSADPPADLRPLLSKPVIGYNGTVAEWFDFALMHAAAEQLPEVHFVIIGKAYREHAELELRKLAARPNVHFLGRRPYSDLPAYNSCYSAGIIPFIVNQVTVSTSPVKLFEYLASGLPVVTTALPECRKYRGVRVTETHAEFLDGLRWALSGNWERAELLAEARANDWEGRARLVLSSLQNLAR